MPERGERGNRGPKRPKHSPRPGGNRPAGPGGRGRGPKPRERTGGKLGLRRLDGDAFELVHPRCVEEMELDYVDGLELWREGDFEAARDALRYALQGCTDNIWVHVALGKLALEEYRDPTLARGHYGFAFELAYRSLPRDFTGRLPRDRGANAPLYEAIEGLAACYDALGQPNEAGPLRDLARRWEGGRRAGPPPQA